MDNLFDLKLNINQIAELVGMHQPYHNGLQGLLLLLVATPN